MVNLLELPTDISLQIFGLFQSPPILTENGIYNSYKPEWNGLATLQAARLTCHSLNQLVSGMICPIFRGRLDRKTMERIEHLARNPLLADGIRVVQLNLAFRPKTIASDLGRYRGFVLAKVESHQNTCAYNTEFQDFEDDDRSDAAIEHRALLAAYNKFDDIYQSWHQCVEPKSQGATNVSYQQLLQDCFADYAARQQVEEAIISDGSFVNAIASAVSRFKNAILLSFVDGGSKSSNEPLDVATNMELLSAEMLDPHDWLTVEDIEAGTELLPARILVDLPIACHQLGAPLQGLSLDCFPLKRSFASLLPRDGRDPAVSWSHLALACSKLATFQLGKNGMSCTPHREEPISEPDCTIVNEYLGAVCSGSELSSILIYMTPFRMTGSSRSRHDPQAADLNYCASSILNKLNSPALTRLHILNVEISGSDLESLISRLPRFQLKEVRLCSIHLNEGSFANAIEILRARKSDSRNCSISFSTFYGGEFGAPKGINDDNSWLFGNEDERHAFWERLDEHMHPVLLQEVDNYISGARETNPLLATPRHGSSR